MVTKVCTAVIVLVAACSSPRPSNDVSDARLPVPGSPLSEQEVKEREHWRCRAYGRDRDVCERDLACMRLSTPHSEMDVMVDRCVPCLEWVAFNGRASPEFCRLRAAGKARSACESLKGIDPARCASLVDAD